MRYYSEKLLLLSQHLLPHFEELQLDDLKPVYMVHAACSPVGS